MELKTTRSKSGFYLRAQETDWSSPPEKDIPFDEYIELVDISLAVTQDVFEQICETAVHIDLPQPDFYRKEPDVEKMLAEEIEKAVPYGMRKEWYGGDEWLYRGYLSFVSVDGKPFCEFRIDYRMKEYLFASVDNRKQTY